MPYEKISQISANGETVILMRERYNESFIEKKGALWQQEKVDNWYIAK